jgi:plasmid replication initiation protein
VVDWDNEKHENNKITKANALVEARYRLTIQEQRLILMCISLLSPEEEEGFPTVRFRIRDVVETLELRPDAYYYELKRVLKRLKSRVLEIPLSEGEKSDYMLLNWVEKATYLGSEGIIELKIHPELKPYLLKLKEKFTTYYLKAVIGLRSTYSVRLYELLKQYEKIGKRRFSLEELKRTLRIEPNEYTRYNDFKRFVILQAQKELKEKTDIYSDFREIKKGRKVVELEFTILENPKIKALKEQEEKEKVEKEKDRLRQRYEELYEKWKPYLEKLNLNRLSRAHAIFFLENSLLEPEQTAKAIEIDDANPMVRNPIATLYSSLPLKSPPSDLWLLKVEPLGKAEPSWKFDWQSAWEKKWSIARRVLSEYGIDYTLPKVPQNEEEAVEILSEVEKVLAKAFWAQLPEEEKDAILRPYEDIRKKDMELFKAILRTVILRRFGIPDLSLYSE